MEIMDMDLHEEHSQQKVVTKSPRSNPKSIKREDKCLSSKVKIKSKQTVKDQKMHRSIFAEGGIKDGTKVYYVSKGKTTLNGHKQGHGIFCYCCNTEISASKFEAHAGRPDRKKPYEHIVFSNGLSLHKYTSFYKRTGKHLATEKDDVCGVCQKGGDLLLCDGCPRSFHIECILETWAPLEKWFCKYCKESMKCVESISNARGMVSAISSIEEVENRCIRIIDNPNKNDLVACSLCRSYDFCEDDFNDQTVIVCDQCELEFHVGCLREHYIANLKELPLDNWFCSVKCGRLNYAIKVLVTFGAQKVPESLLGNVTNLDMEWIIVHGKHASEENKYLLAEAGELFHGGFNPIIDSVTGMDFIEAMLYNQKMNASDFSGVHCAIIKMNSIVVTAGLFRVFGHEIVELPIVATGLPFKGNGYFKLFFTCFEKLLSFLKIKKLVVPAAEEAKTMWTHKFGFRKVTPMEQSEYRQKQTAMVAFDGTCLLEKNVPEAQITFEGTPFFSLSMG